ncbi:siderophore-interacting protein [Brevibacterium sp. CFH 10365]|uniref:siderophore-interacting protein n=1 Tax=Brevibacterium sp. CFH 10365 TaxID=2585207 RepID=UPI00126640A1|nr:siderophore-interacting protein [Brevibacterium sp. CFH 10365]
MPRTSRPLQVLPIILREVEVTGIVDITPNMRRLTVAGDQLAAGGVGEAARPAFRSEGFDDHVKLVIPPPDGSSLDIGEQEEFRFNWNREALNRARDYTVRSVDHETNSFSIDIVRHDSGLASDWAFGVAVGDRISFAGPKTCAGLADDIDFHLLVADETALPAVGRWLEEAPAGTRGHIIIEVPTSDDIQDIPTEADVEIDWLIRGSTAPGESRLMFDAVKNLDLPEGRTFAWCAGETLTIAPIRRYLRREIGLPKEDVEVVGYWRKMPTRPAEAGAAVDSEAGSTLEGSAAVSASAGSGAAGSPDSAGPAATGSEGRAAPDSTLEVLHQVHEMTELLPAIITRTAVTLGINDLIAGGVATAEAIAAELGIAADRVRPVLTAMCSLGLLAREGEAYRNTPTGAVLTGEGASDGLDLSDPAMLDLFSLVDLVDVLRGGFASRTSRASATEAPTWHDQRAADPGLDAAHRRRSLDHLQYVLDLILDLEPVAAAGSLAVVGDVDAEAADALTRKAPHSGQTIHTPGAESLSGRRSWPDVDCTLVIAGLTGRSRAEVTALLDRMLAASRTLIIVEPFTDEAEADDHQAEELITTLATTGNPSLTSDGLIKDLHALGAAHVEVKDIGWGFGRFRSAVIATRS